LIYLDKWSLCLWSVLLNYVPPIFFSSTSFARGWQ